MTESSARTVLLVTGATAIIAYIAAIIFGLRGDQAISIAFFAIAIADSAAAYWASRQYNRLRDERWSAELRSTEQKMADLMAQEANKQEPKSET
jgi:hypothetical protein